jgi:hypothetical protein
MTSQRGEEERASDAYRRKGRADGYPTLHYPYFLQAGWTTGFPRVIEPRYEAAFCCHRGELERFTTPRAGDPLTRIWRRV